MNFDLIEYFKKNRIFYRDSGKNVGRDEINICCIDCGEDGYHLGINLKKQMYHCWKCDIGGTLAFLISRFENCSYQKAVELISKPNRKLDGLEKTISDYQISIINNITNNTNKIATTIFKLPPFPKFLMDESKNIIFKLQAVQYLCNRGITSEIIKKANLHYCYYGKYKNRIIVPIYYQNKLVNFLGRTWDIEAKKRYINCPNDQSLISSKKLLYNYDNIQQNVERLIIVEGVFDCFKSGLNRTVATLGTAVTFEQKQLILKLNPKELIILFDGEAYSDAIELANWFNFYIKKIKVIKLPYSIDPGSCSYSEIDKYINEKL